MDARDVHLFRAAAEMSVRNPDRAEVFLKAAMMAQDERMGAESWRTIPKVRKPRAQEVRP